MRRRHIFLEGPDGCGKTEISAALSRKLGISCFKAETETSNWYSGTFVNSLMFDFMLSQFVRDTNTSFISDRGFPSEWVYSKVFERETSEALLEKIDERFAKTGSIIILALRRDYSNSRHDDLVPQEKLVDIHDMYNRFAAWTKCKVIKLYVDDFNNNTELQINSLLPCVFKAEDTPGKVIMEPNKEEVKS